MANPFQWKSIIETFQKIPSLTNWASLTFEQKVKYAESMGLSTNAYGDAAVKIFEIASQFALDNAWVILAISLTVLAARFIGRFVSEKLQSTIDDLKQDQKTSNTKVEPTFTDSEIPK